VSRSSPMMEQYRSIKEQHPDKLLMFQVGDFYELFFEDAEIAAREMDIVLTSRDGGSENPIPLAGVPIHAAETYLNKLLGKGFKVVICDQIESATQAKGLVKRAVTRILTPGTISETEMLDEGKNNYLAVIVHDGNMSYGLAAVDVSTGEFLVTEQSGSESWPEIADELKRFQPSEIICPNSELEEYCLSELAAGRNNLVTKLKVIPDLDEAVRIIDHTFGAQTAGLLQTEQYPQATIAAATALIYLQDLKQLPAGSRHFRFPNLYFINKYMLIDSITSKNLELTEAISSGGKKGSLLGIIDHCLTGMGRRLLKRRLEQPLLDLKLISARQDSVEELIKKPLSRREIRLALNRIFDLERFCGRLAYQKVTPRDLAALKNTLRHCDPLKKALGLLETDQLSDLGLRIPDFAELISLIDRALEDEPPVSLKEGGIFRDNYNAELDRLKMIARDGGKMLLDFEKEERNRTGIKSLRVGFNRNFGYYIEVTKTNLELVPPEYHRKQTLVGAERYTTEELHNIEEQLTGAREKLLALELSLYEDLLERIGHWMPKLLEAAEVLSELDFRQGLAETAELYRYCRPQLNTKRNLQLKECRHPVVEQLAFEQFVPNNVTADPENFILLITGPNMAGKSTYIRSVAISAILGQIGSFVPAAAANLPLFDRIFARVGASDDLSRGHSTFMVEMIETATILNEASANSLIILDEIGRGTSTYDGMSIARAVLEYISTKIKAITLFSTHYHELTRLEGELEGVKNYNMAVKERGKEVIFLRQVLPGKADKSYGINVARLAGLPVEVLLRAETVLSELEIAASTAAEQQLSLLPIISSRQFVDNNPALELINKLKDYDLNRMTPLDSMKALYEVQKELLDLEE
jgi:DNA mismatch repair protein MutS